MKERTAIVTGVMGGIGFETAKRLIEAGAFVFGMSRSDRDAVQDKLDELGERFCYVRGDVKEGADRERLVKAALARSGQIDVLVNVAGVAPLQRSDLLEMTEESYDRVMSINTKGLLFLTQAVAREMVKNDPVHGIKGYIVNISSCSAYTSSVSRGEYCISKAGVSMITKLFADRLAGEGVLVNEICPGIILTGMTETVKQKYDDYIAAGNIPLSRWGTPEDVAKAVVALSDGTFGYTTGESLIVDGGMHIRKL